MSVGRTHAWGVETRCSARRDSCGVGRTIGGQGIGTMSPGNIFRVSCHSHCRPELVVEAGETSLEVPCQAFVAVWLRSACGRVGEVAEDGQILRLGGSMVSSTHRLGHG